MKNTPQKINKAAPKAPKEPKSTSSQPMQGDPSRSKLGKFDLSVGQREHQARLLKAQESGDVGPLIRDAVRGPKK